MNPDQNNVHVYPMKRHWQVANQILGFWSWACAIAGIVGSLFLPLIFFPWTRKVIPAFRRMLIGESRSFLRTSENGLEYRNWPFWEMRCKWDNVKSISKGNCFGDVLYLEGAEENGFLEFSIKLSRRQIPLGSLTGWPDDGLEDDLHKYAPHLFGK